MIGRLTLIASMAVTDLAASSPEAAGATVPCETLATLSLPQAQVTAAQELPAPGGAGLQARR